MKKLTNIRLLLLLVVLVAVYAVIELTGGKSRSDAFRKDLVTFTDEKVDRVVIEKGEQKLQLTKSGDTWKVKTEDGYEVDAEQSKVANALSMLHDIIPNRVAARDQQKWSEYQVDSAGTKVQVYEEGKKVVDIVLGRFGMANQRQFYSFVRLTEEPTVYSVNDFMSMSFPSKSESYRNNVLLKFNKDSVEEISFVYPADSAFVLTKAEDKWYLDNQAEIEIKKVTDFINAINYKNSSDFEDSINKSDMGAPTLSVILKIAGEDGPITLDAYQHESFKWVLNSSLNKKNWFSDSDESEIKRFFKGSGYFTN